VDDGPASADVRSVPPPLWLMRYVANPVLRRLLPTRLGRWIPAAVLQVTGRRSGRHYRIPLLVHDVDDGTVVFTDAAWALNFRAGAEAELVRAGHRHRVRGVLAEDGAQVGPWLREVLAAGTSARLLGLAIRRDHVPSDDEAAAVRRAVLLTEIPPL
jgi:hypothetical protein